jgi:cellulose synthase/poly-beta-1,6-N-acetylglucosamine synthase-like glycosyltransferase
MEPSAVALLVVHYGVLLLLGLYGLHRLYLTVVVVVGRNRPIDPHIPGGFQTLPVVTVQLPVFNERHVIERLIDAAAALDYPHDRLHIQVLDDSTDETTELAAARVRHHAAAGLRIDHVRRPDRSGFKAGALAWGLDRTDGEFVLILDADFVPGPDFLRLALPPLADPAVGMVQARWSYLNREHSLLTRTQAMLLDAHFAIEQTARARRGVFFNFNGTAGIWRAEAIRDAGGWRADTLTEDLDLSYRAQLRGWRFAYRDDLTCPSELPTDINALKTQQHRWAKGAIEVMRALLPRVWATRLPFTTKVEASFHLTSNLAYLLLLIDSLFLVVPTIVVRERYDLDILLWLDLPLFALATLSHIGFFLAGQARVHSGVGGQIGTAFALMAMLIGLCFNNGRAVAEALAGRRSPFVRTPKQGDAAVSRAGARYSPARTPVYERIEILLGLAYGVCVVWAVDQGYWVGAPFPALFAVMFLMVGVGSMRLRHAPA